MKCPADRELMKIVKITKMEFINICYLECPRCRYKKTEYVKRMVPLSVEKRNNKRGK